MNILLFLADGFELVEAMTPLDLLRRAGAKVTTVSLSDNTAVTSSNGVVLHADSTLATMREVTPDLIILPGGMPGAANLRNCKTVCDMVTDAVRDGRAVGAICAAPMILGELGLLEGIRATCFPGFEDSLKGAHFSAKRVVRDGNIVTAAGMGVSLPFASTLVSLLYGEDKAKELLTATMAE